MSDHAQTILSAIIPDRRDLLDRALQSLSDQHFLDPVYRNIFRFLDRYAAVTGSVLSRQALVDQLEKGNIDSGKVLHYSETYDLLASIDSSEADFRWALSELREQVASSATEHAIKQAATILTKGVEFDGQDLKGQSDARSFLMTQFADIDKELSLQDSPEGDVRQEVNEILDDYSERKRINRLGVGEGVDFGIPPLDAKLGGLQRGEMCLVIGASGAGKTSCVSQLGWHAATQQGKNVVIVTTETLRDQVRRKMVARHSKLSKFGLEHGLNTRDIKSGTLSETEEIRLKEVVEDLGRNPSHGVLYIWQVPRGATVSMMENQMYRLQRQFNIDLVIADYLALFRAERKRNSTREELSDILKSGKQFCTTFNDGIGVPLVSPWQVSRAAQLEAERVGYYTLASLAETAEATNSSDVVMSMLAQDTTDRYGTTKGQILKNRDGERSDPAPLLVDYATSCFTDAAVIGSPSSGSFGVEDKFGSALDSGW